MNDTETIAVILCVIVIILLIFKYYNNTNKSKDHFTLTPDQYKNEILSKLNYDISSIRNLAQLANNTLIDNGTNLYLPIDTVSPQTIKSHETVTINGNLIINKKSEEDEPISFINKNNDLSYFDLFYKGMIIPWASHAAEVPYGWAICNGDSYYYSNTTGEYLNLKNVTEDERNKYWNNDKYNNTNPIVTTPNLTSRFILHENSIKNYSSENTNDKLDWILVDKKPLGIHEINEKGGEESVLLSKEHLPSHFHTVNFYMNYSYDIKNLKSGGEQAYYDNYRITKADFESEKSKIPDLSSQPWHAQLHYIALSEINISPQTEAQHPISTYTHNSLSNIVVDASAFNWDYLITRDNLRKVTGTDIVTYYAQTRHENMPPWYALYYIMKLY